MRKRTRAPSASAKKRVVKPKTTRVRFRSLANPMVNKINQKMRCEMTYCEYGVTLNGGAGSAAPYVFAANGLNDPNITGVGHQPMGFDQLMELYNQYTVLGGIIKVTFDNTDTALSQLIGITFKDTATTTADPRQYIEWGNTTWTTVAPLAGGSSSKTLTHKFDVAKFAGQEIADEQNFTGTKTSNPDNTLHLIIWAAAANAVGDPAAVVANVEIMYDVILKSPVGTALS